MVAQAWYAYRPFPKKQPHNFPGTSWGTQRRKWVTSLCVKGVEKGVTTYTHLLPVTNHLPFPVSCPLSSVIEAE